MTTKKTVQHAEYLEHKKEDALTQFAQLSLPPKDKQDIGTIDLSSSLDITKKEKSDTIQIVSIPKEIVCMSFEAALQDPHCAVLFQKKFMSLLPLENKYDALHYATLSNSLFVYIPTKKKCNIPLHIERYSYAPHSSFHILIIAEAQSELTIITEEKGEKEPGFVSTFVEATLEQESHVTVVSLEEYDEKKQHYIRKNASVAKDGKMEWVEAYFGSMYIKTTVSAHLQQDGASATNTTLFFGEQKQKFDIISQTYQHAPHTFANMNTIGVVSDTARSMCRGLIKIDQPAYSSVGHQKIKTLLMNKDAQANAIPSMQIDNFDVRATHESSVGQISKDKLFYLMSRGLDEKQSRTTIVEGYFQQLTALIPDESIKKQIMGLIQKKLGVYETERGEEKLYA